MKHLALVVLALAACSKPNDLATLQASAASLASYYKPRAAELEHRMEHLNRHSTRLVNPGDREAAQAAFGEATNALRDMNAMIATSQQQADTLAAAGKRAELEKLVQDEREKLEDDETKIDEALSTDDSWIADQEHAPANVPPPPSPAVDEQPPAP